VKGKELWLGGGLAVVLVVAMLLTRGFGGGDEPDVDLDVTNTDGELVVGDVSVQVTAEPRPMRVFDELQFAFRFTRSGETVAVDDPLVDFDMVMDMGPHEYRLVPDESGTWRAEDVVLPQCGSGSRLWFGELTFEAEGKPHVARIRLELAQPPQD